MGMDPDGKGGGEELREVEGEETIVRIYFVTKTSIFNKRGKEKSLNYI